MDKEKQRTEKPSPPSEQKNDRTTTFAPTPLWKPSKSLGSLDNIDQEMIIEEEKRNITENNLSLKIKKSKPAYAIQLVQNEEEQKSNKKLVIPTLEKRDSGSPLAVTKRMAKSKREITSEAFNQNMSTDEYAQQQFFSQQVNDNTIRLSPSPEQYRKRAIDVFLGKTFTRQNIFFGFGLVFEFVGIGLGIHFMLKTNTFELGLALTCAFGVLLCLTILFKVSLLCCSSENQRREAAIQRIDTTYETEDLTNQREIMNNVTSK